MAIEKLVDVDGELIERAAATLIADGQSVDDIPAREVFARSVETWLPVVVALVRAGGLVHAAAQKRRPRRFEERTWDALDNAEKVVDVARVALLRSALELQAQHGDGVKRFLRSLAATGVEQPYSDIQWLENGTFVVNPGSGIITTPGVARNLQDLLDFTGHLRYDGDYGHAQVAGVLRKLTYQPATGNSALDELGYGINVTGSFHPWAALRGCPKGGDDPDIWQKSRFLGQFAAGRGINRYIQDVNGLGLDATFDPANGFRAIPSYGWFVGYEQWWTKKWLSNFTVGDTISDLTDSLPGNTYKRAYYATANIIWLPVERMGVGLEFLYGTRENKDGQRGEAYRLQAAFQYKF